MQTPRLWLIAILFLVACGSSLQAQTFWDYVGQYDTGYGLKYFTLRGYAQIDSAGEQRIPLSEDLIGISYTYGFYYPFMSLGKDLSWGIQPNFGVTTAWSSLSSEGGDFIATLNVPVFAMIKYGTDAEFYGKKPFGVGVGVGYNLQGLLSLSGGLDLTGIYHGPEFLVEASVVAGKLGLVKLRFMTSLIPTKIDKPWTSERYDGNQFIGNIDLKTYGLYLSTTKNF